jgi:nitrate reductase gamma subunit
MILAGWGLKEELVSDLDPWLCYYCGECSKNCPRKAEPGELMMSLRRFLISAYDWTGISKILYKSKYAEYIAILIVALGVLIEWAVLFGLYPAAGASLAQAVSPDKIDYFFDWPITVFLGVMLTSFIYNMFRKTVLSDKNVKIPLKLYFTEAWSLMFNFFTQYRYAKCDDSEESSSKKLAAGKYNFWLTHLFLMISYVILFVGIVFFLDWFQSENSLPYLHIILFDYFASIGLIFGTVYFVIKRLTKKIERSKFSHHTDWMFVILLFLTGVSGVLLRAAIVYKFSTPSIFYIYLVHLMILFPMLIIEVPFSKWSHLAYRPVAIYFANLKEKAKSLNAGSNENAEIS